MNGGLRQRKQNTSHALELKFATENEDDRSETHSYTLDIAVGVEQCFGHIQ